MHVLNNCYLMIFLENIVFFADNLKSVASVN